MFNIATQRVARTLLGSSSKALLAFTPRATSSAATRVMPRTVAISVQASFSTVNVRHFSTAPLDVDVSSPAVVEKPLRALSTEAVQKIKAELMEVDANFDGRIDSDELKVLLRKHSNVFTDEEIIELSNMYYTAKAGGSVRFDQFIEAIDLVAEKFQNENNSKLEDRVKRIQEQNTNPLGIGSCGVEFAGLGKPHAYYTKEDFDNFELTHVEPKDNIDKLALNCVKAVRFLFDTATGWRSDNITTTNILNRTIYLETIAAVPGMVAAIVRHFRSLRNMEADGGYMQLFLEEANNERMHLLTFVRMKDPGLLFRGAVIVGQFGFGAAFTLSYILSPRFCHRFVGYVEEEACVTYTKIIKAIESAPEGSELGEWRTQTPPKIAIAYWKLGEQSTVLDLMKAVRADEAEHRDVNHEISGLKKGQVNPFYDPATKLDNMLGKYVKAIMTRGRD